MDGGNAGGGGGPAPFLLKTYDMVDDSSTDDIVSWSASQSSFVVWKPAEFSTLLLPTYFKHNNFASFIRQLNTYGFGKIDPEKWEFANKDFVKDQKHLLKNIHRRKPIHSHNQPHNVVADAERTALEEEIEKLTRDKNALQSELLRFEQQQTGTNTQMEILEQRVQDMEQRQLRMMAFLAKAAKNPTFVEHLILMAGTSEEISAISKKRRLPSTELVQEVVDNNFVDTHSCTSKPDYGQLFNQEFSNKLKLELCPAISDCNLMSASVQSSTEGGSCPLRNFVEADPKTAQLGTSDHSIDHEILELSDTGTSCGIKKILSLFGQSKMSENPGEDPDCCQLDLSLASSSLHVNKTSYGSGLEIGTSSGLTSSPKMKEVEHMAINNRNPSEENTMPSPQVHHSNIQVSGAAQTRVNDVFWEQFLTERPGSADTEVATCGLRPNPSEEQEEIKSASGIFWRGQKNIEQLTNISLL